MASTQTATAAASAYHPPLCRRLTTYEQREADNATSGTTPPFDKGDTPSFADLIDIINPLQHIPVVNTIYRAITGDHEGAVADVVGGTLYGGPLGAAAAIADLGLRDATGEDAGEHVMAWLGFDSGSKAGATAVAAAKAATPAQTAAAAPAPAAKQLAMAGAPQPAAPMPAPLQPVTRINLQAGPAIGAPTSLQAGPAPTPAIAQPGPAAGGSGGPVTMGDYLVFGGGGAPAIKTSMNFTPNRNPGGQNPGGQSQGNGPAFATIGANMPPALALPTLSAPPASAQTASSMPPLAGTAKTAAAMPLQPRVFPVPPRTGPASPAVNLPPPTTGPGALPGGKSQALSAQELAAQGQNQAFLSAYTQALERYQNAQRLGAAGGPMGGAPAAPAPTNLIQPANDVTEENTENGPAVTVH